MPAAEDEAAAVLLDDLDRLAEGAGSGCMALDLRLAVRRPRQIATDHGRGRRDPEQSQH